MAASLADMKKYLEDMKEELLMFEDKEEILEFMIELGSELEELPKDKQVDENRVPGCVSNVHIFAEKTEDGKIIFKGSSESLIVKGYVELLVRSLSGLTPEEVQEAGPLIEAFLQETKVNVSMVPSRANSFGNIYNLMKKQAEALA